MITTRHRYAWHITTNTVLDKHDLHNLKVVSETIDDVIFFSNKIETVILTNNVSSAVKIEEYLVRV